jgi:hypothetical protein
VCTRCVENGIPCKPGKDRNLSPRRLTTERPTAEIAIVKAGMSSMDDAFDGRTTMANIPIHSNVKLENADVPLLNDNEPNELGLPGRFPGESFDALCDPHNDPRTVSFYAILHQSLVNDADIAKHDSVCCTSITIRGITE